MGRNITRFADRVFFHTLDLSLLERLLMQCNVPTGLLPDERAARLDALFDIFYTADTRTIELHEALYSIMRLDNHDGMTMLVDAAVKEGIRLEVPTHTETGGTPPPVAPRHLALKAYLDHRPLFDEALDLLAFTLPRAPLEWQGLEENVRPAPEDASRREAFRQAASAYFQSYYRGDYCKVRWFDEGDVLVEHGKHLQTILRERMGQGEPLTFHEIRTSTIRYDVPTGFLKVTGEADRDKVKLKELFAVHVLDRPDFFEHADSQNLYTLDPVVEAGPSFQLKRGPDEALKKWVIREIQFDEGERWQGRRKRKPRGGQTVWHVSNAVAYLGELMPDLDFASVRFTSMKFDLEFFLDGRKQRTCPTVKPPGILRAPQGKLEPRIQTFLRHNGLCRPRRAPAAAAAAD